MDQHYARELKTGLFFVRYFSTYGSFNISGWQTICINSIHGLQDCFCIRFQSVPINCIAAPSMFQMNVGNQQQQWWNLHCIDTGIQTARASAFSTAYVTTAPGALPGVLVSAIWQRIVFPNIGKAIGVFLVSSDCCNLWKRWQVNTDILKVLKVATKLFQKLYWFFQLDTCTYLRLEIVKGYTKQRPCMRRKLFRGFVASCTRGNQLSNLM